MSLLQKHLAQSHAYSSIRQIGADPFAVRFDAVLSPTEAELDGRRVVLLGTNNYLGLTFDAECVEASIEAVRRWGTGTTGSRIANGSFGAHVTMERALARF